MIHLTIRFSLANMTKHLYAQCIFLCLLLLCSPISVTSMWAFDVNGMSYQITSGNQVKLTKGLNQAEVNIPETVTYNGTTYTVTEIGARAFSGYSNTRKITFPKTIRIIGDHAVYDNYYLEEIELNEGLVRIETDAFGYAYPLKEIRIPSTVTYIGHEAFITNGTNYASIYCYASTPPTIADNTALQGRTGTTLHVTRAAVDRYRTATYWSSFSTISGDIIYINDSFDADGMTYQITSDNEVKLTKGLNQAQVSIPNTVNFYSASYTVTEIASKAFSGYTNTKIITIPNTIKSIGADAFKNNSNLEQVTFNEGLESIGSGAFDNNNALTEIRIPNSVTTIGENAFHTSQANKAAIFSLAVTPPTIQPTSFAGRTGATLHVRNGAVKSYQSAASWNAFTKISGDILFVNDSFDFDGMSYQVTSSNQVRLTKGLNQSEVSIPETATFYEANYTVTEIAASAFSNYMKTKNVTIPSTVRAIGAEAFKNNYNLEQVVFNDGLKTIGSGAFDNNYALAEIRIPRTVSAIGENAFRTTQSTQAKNIYCLATTPPAIQSTTFSGRTSATLHVLKSAVASYSGAANWNTFSKIIAEDSSSDNNGSDDNNGDNNGNNHESFEYSSMTYQVTSNNEVKLTLGRNSSTVSIPRTVTYNNMSYTVTEIAENAFSGYIVRRLTIPETVRTIGDHAFSSNTNLYQVTFNEGLQTIGTGAFENNYALTEISIPRSVTKIGDNAFGTDQEIGGQVYCMASTPPVISSTSFSGRTNSTLHVPIASADIYQRASNWNAFSSISDDLGSTVGESFAYSSMTYQITSNNEVKLTQGRNASTITIPETVTYNNMSYTVTEIADSAFSGYMTTRLTIPGSVRTIGDRAFYSNTGLYQVTFNEGLKTIGSGAFENNYALTEIRIPSSVTTIGENTFRTDQEIQGDITCLAITPPAVKATTFSGRTSATLHVPCSSADTYKGIDNWRSFSTISGDIFSIGDSFELEGMTYLIKPNNEVSLTKGLNQAEVAIQETIYFDGKTYTVNEIASEAFSGYSNTKKVTIPTTIKSIGADAFKNNSNLEQVVFNEGLKTIGGGAFDNNTELTGICIPSSVTTIGENAFRTTQANKAEITCLAVTPPALQATSFAGRTSITLHVPAAVADTYRKTANWNLFTSICPILSVGDCFDVDGMSYQLISEDKEVTLTKGLNQVEVMIPDVITYYDVKYIVREIAPEVFSSYMKTKKVTIPGTVRAIGADAFKNNYNLEQVVFNDGLKTIGSGAFDNNYALTEIRIPRTVTAIGENAFRTTQSNQAKIYCLATTPPAIQSTSFSGRTNTILHVLKSAVASYSGSTNWSSFSKISAEEGSGDNNGDDNGNNHEIFEYGDMTFQIISNHEVKLTKGRNEGWPSIPTSVYYNDTKYTVAEIASEAFSGYEEINEIIIPNTVRAIGDCAFYNNTNLKHVELNEGLKTIGRGAFENNYNLQIIQIPGSVTAIEEKAFSTDQEIQGEITCLAATPPTIKPTSFGGRTNTTLHVLRTSSETYQRSAIWKQFTEIIGDLGYIIGDSFSNGGMTYQVTSPNEVTLTQGNNQATVIIPATITVYDVTYTVTKIANNAFYGYKNTRKVSIPGTIRSIGNTAFYDNYYLEEVLFSEGLQTISDGAFQFNFALKEIRIPSTVVSIGAYSFYTNQTNRANLYSSAETPPSIQSTTFGGRTSTTLHVPGSATETYRGAANWNSFSSISGDILSVNDIFELDGVSYQIKPNNEVRLTKGLDQAEVIIPANVSYSNTTYKVTEIASEAYSGYANTKKVTIPSTVKTIGYDAFKNNSNLEQIMFNEGLETIGSGAFDNNNAIMGICIPSSVTTIEENAFRTTQVNKATITCLAEIPPSIQSTSFAGRTSSTLYVPAAVTDTYRRSTNWSLFSTISPYDRFDINGLSYQVYEDRKVRLTKGLNQANVVIPDTITNNGYSYIVTEIASEAFAGFMKTKKVTVPKTVKTIGINAFYNNYNLEQVVFNEGLETIGSGAFDNNYALTEIRIPSTVTIIENNAFRTSQSVNTPIYCEARLPQIQSSSFEGRTNATLHVRYSMANSFKNAENWNKFSSILDDILSVGDNFSWEGMSYKKTSDSEVSLTQGVNQEKVIIPETIDVFGVTYTVTEIAGSAFYNFQTIRNVTIPGTVKFIGANAFYNNCLTTVVFNEGLEKIGDRAFYSDQRYTSVLSVIRIPSSVVSIGSEAFRANRTSSSNSIYCLAAQPPVIQSNTFGSRNIGKLYVLPSAIDLYRESVGWNEFSNIQAVSNYDYDFSFDVDGMSYQTISGKNVRLTKGLNQTEVIIPEKVNYNGITCYVSEIESEAFYGYDNTKKITIPRTIYTIGSNAFKNNSNLEQVVFNEGLRTIGNGAFENNDALTEISIPSSVTTIEENAFRTTQVNKAKITCLAETPPTIQSTSFAGRTSSLLHVSTVAVDTYRRASNWNLFSEIIGMLLVNSSFELDGTTYQVMSSNEVKLTKGLNQAEVIIPDSITYNGSTFIITEIASNAFSGYNNTKSITIPGTIKTIGNYAFSNNSNLEQVVFSEGLETIGAYSFDYNYALNDIRIPSSVTTIGENAFRTNQTYESTVYCMAVNPPTIQSTSFSGRTYSTLHVLEEAVAKYQEAENWNSFEDVSGDILLINECFDVDGMSYQVTSISEVRLTKGVNQTEVIIPEKVNKNGTTYYVSEIATEAFYGYENLKSVSIPKTVKTIGSDAFKNNYNLEQVVLNDGLKTIGSGAFDNNYALTEIRIPSSVTNIGENAFHTTQANKAAIYCLATTPASIKSTSFGGRTSTTLIVLKAAVDTYRGATNWNLFSSIRGLGSVNDNIDVDGMSYQVIADNEVKLIKGINHTEVIIPDSISFYGDTYFVTEIGADAFSGYENTNNVTIPKTVKVIGDSAFYHNTHLNEIVFNEGLETIGRSSFEDNNELMVIRIPSSVTFIGEKAFHSNDFCEVYCYAITPPSIQVNSFEGRKDGILYVPIVDTYQRTDNWNQFSTIRSILSVGDSFDYEGMKYQITSTNEVKLTQGANQSEVIIPDSITCYSATYAVTEIASYAFYSYKNTRRVVVPGTVKTIGTWAFYDNYYLQKIVFNEGLERIENNCFDYNFALTEIRIPSSVTYIGSYAFRTNQTNRASIYCLAITPPSIQSTTFTGRTGTTLHVQKAAAKNYREIENWNSFTLISGDVGSVGENFDMAGMSYQITSKNEVTLTKGLNLEEVVIPETVTYLDVTYIVTEIASDAFSRCENTKKVAIPETVKAIGSNAFFGCTGLTSITIPNSVTMIENDAFCNCTGLTSITIPNSVTSIGSHAFSGCKNLTSITIPNSVTTIEVYAFGGCTGLTSVTIPNSVTTIEEYAFYNCTGLTSITIPNSVTTIGSSPFSGCTGLTCVTINTPTVKSWFAGLTGLQKVEFGEKVDTICDGAFRDCIYLDSIVLSRNLTDISVSAFSGCEGMTSVTINTTTVRPWFAGLTKLRKVELGEKVDTICDGAFANCTALIDISLPNNLRNIGENAFKGCTGLTSTTLPAKAEIAVSAFTGCSELSSVTINTPTILPWFAGNRKLQEVKSGTKVDTVSVGAFKGCIALSSVNLPSTLTDIKANGFEGCTSLTGIVLPDSLKNIGENAFKGCTALDNINFPTALTSIKDNGFEGCKSLASITIPNNVTIGNFAFKGCTGLSEITIPKAASVSMSAFNGCLGIKKATINTPNVLAWFAGMENIEDVILGDSVSTISDYAFAGCTALTYMTLPKGLTSIKANSFEGCTSLTSITLPDSLKNIAGNAFKGCTGFISITLPEKADIAVSAFKDCSELASVTIKTSSVLPWFAGNTKLSSVKLGAKTDSICEGAFKGCSTLRMINLPVSLTAIKAHAFNGCTGLASIKLPDNLSTIGANSFDGCSGLTGITIPSRVNVGDFAFKGCSGLTEITLPKAATVSMTAFNGCVGIKKATLHTPEVLTWFAGMENIEDVVLGDSVANISDLSFNGCTGLTSIVLPDGLSTIGANSFEGCAGLTGITIPSRVNVGDFAFKGCSGLTEITLSKAAIVSMTAFNGCLGIKKATIHTSEVLTWFAGMENIENVVLGDSVSAISDLSFNGCTGLTSIVLPDGLSTIGANSFEGCTGLTGVTIPSRVSIGDFAFKGCSGLTEITLPKAATVSMTAFNGCIGIKKATIHTSEVLTWFAGMENIEDVVLGDSVSTISDLSFNGCSGLTSIALPYGLSTIGANSFEGCTGLTGVTIPSRVSIGDFAFKGCSGLTEITLPKAATVSMTAFNGCVGIKKATIHTPEVLTWFAGMENIEDVVLGDSVLTISNNAFNGCSSLTNINLPAALTAINASSFEGCSALSEILLPDNLVNIGDNAFKGCTGLNSINIPSRVTLIGSSAFYGCNGLTSVVIPKNVASIGNSAFDNCKKLASVTINSNAVTSKTYTSSSSLSSVFGKQVTEYVFGDEVESIGAYACYNCSSLDSIYIESQVNNIGTYAFGSCKALTFVTINSNSVMSKAYTASSSLSTIFGQQVTKYVLGENVEKIGNYAFYNASQLKSITIPNSVSSYGNYAFYGCAGLTSISIPDGLTSIGNSTFGGCSGLTSMVIPNSVTSIGSSAFQNCTNLNAVNIPSFVTSISNNTFSGCSNLVNIVIPDNVTSIGSSAFQNCEKLVTIDIPSNVTNIGSSAFTGCTTLTSILIPSNVITIGNAAFSNCNALKSVRINSNAIVSKAYTASSNLSNIFGQQVTGYVFAGDVESIGAYACYNCSSLDSVRIGNWVTSIGNSAFQNCTSLNAINIPAEVTTIGSSAFAGCTNLASVSLPNKLQTIGAGGFQGCTSLTNINMPASLTKIESQGFEGCTSLTKMSFPETLQTIGDYAFSKCSGLKEIGLSAKAVIGNYAFMGCTGLTTITLPKNASVNATAFNGCTGLTSATIYTPKVQTWFAGMSNIKSIELGTEVTTIGSGAFKGCTSLPTVDLSYVATIEANSFEGCTGMTEIQIPAKGTVGDYAFKGCTGLTEMTIPYAANVSASAFNGCTGLNSVAIYTPKVLAWFAGMNKIKSVELGNEVTTIGTGAFKGCTSLPSIDLPNYLTSIEANSFENCYKLGVVKLPARLNTIGNYAYKGCTTIAEVTITEGVQSLGTGAFSGCSALKTVSINSAKVVAQSGQMTNIFGNQVTKYVVGDQAKSIGSNTFGDSNSKTVELPDNITSLGSSAFGSNTTIKVYRGSKSLLTLWTNGYVKPVDMETSEVLPPSKATFLSSTQATATFVIDNIYPEYNTFCDGTVLKGSKFTVTGLVPEQNGNMTLKVATDDNVAYTTTASYTAKSLNLSTKTTMSPTAFTAVGNYEDGDAEIVEQRMSVSGKAQVTNSSIMVGGLEPNTDYQYTYTVVVGYGDKGHQRKEYSTSRSVRTGKLELKTLAPKVITPGEVIVAAESNITNDEEKVGFEWRRTDAPEDVASRSGEAFLFEGTMEGYLHNLASFNYWRFRPYYESASGTKYYGDWGTVEATDNSYFEPTVHTYAKVEVGENSAVVKGYATRGTDDVTGQGFAYWEENAASRSDVQSHRAASVPSNAKTVAASGQVMTANITGLAYKHTYHYVAFIKTAKGTYYGEVQTFTTGESPNDIDIIRTNRNGENVTIEARYDASGRRISVPVKGLNILHMSDGTTRKIYVK